ncbi:MAG: MCE family protein [Betaproteobacteria bacterium]|nr:MCE family protein [Betaproteobacteria bacterium]
MSKRANPTLVGSFVFGALALAVIATLLLTGGELFQKRRQHVMYFEGAVHGLQVGAPVVFLGVQVGAVKKIEIGLEEQGRRFVVPVTIEVAHSVVRSGAGEQIDLRDRAVIRQLVDRGLRGRLRLQSLLTGQLYIEMDFFPDRPVRFVSVDPDVSEIPTVRGTVEEITKRLDSFAADKFLADLSSISDSINKIVSSPAANNLAQRLDATLRHLESLAQKLDAQGGPVLEAMRGDLAEARKTLVAVQGALSRVEAAADRIGALASPDADAVKNLAAASRELERASRALRDLAEEDSPTVQNLNRALRETSKAARSLRALVETLEQQPESLVRGKRTPEGQ